MLTLDVELLTGAYRACLPDGRTAEWPPHPDRVFSALVQAWGDGGRRDEERAALEWLERQEPPAVEAATALGERDAPTVYVPPNDIRGHEEEALPARRRRQARTFRVTVPEDPLIRMRWGGEPPQAALGSLSSLARRVASLGHSASLVRMAFRTDDHPVEREEYRLDPKGSTALRVPYAGRLEDLEHWFSRSLTGPRVERPRPRRTARYSPSRRGAPADHPRSVFGDGVDWYVFESDPAGDATSGALDILAFAHVARRVRAALMSAGPQPPPEVVSGHGPDGGPSQRPHMAVVPLANVGFPHSTGDLLGFALVLPREVSPEVTQAFLSALLGVASFDGDRARVELQLSRSHRWRVVHAGAPSRASLAPGRWCGPARRWASVTPVMLDRHPDKGDVAGMAGIVAAACRNVGLPEPTCIELHEHSAIRGAVPANGWRTRGRDCAWTFPQESSLRHRPRRHVVLDFEEPVAGPVLLGAGRYQGFGLCLPFPDGGAR